MRVRANAEVLLHSRPQVQNPMGEELFIFAKLFNSLRQGDLTCFLSASLHLSLVVGFEFMFTLALIRFFN